MTSQKIMDAGTTADLDHGLPPTARFRQCRNSTPNYCLRMPGTVAASICSRRIPKKHPLTLRREFRELVRQRTEGCRWRI